MFYHNPMPQQKKRPTGPNTEAGKAAIRRNPIKHGITAQTPVIPLVEDEQDWLDLRDGVIHQLDARGALQTALAERIAGIIWRLQRTLRFEVESTTAGIEDIPRDWLFARKAARLPAPARITPEHIQEMDRMIAARLLPGADTLDKVHRHETTLHRFLRQSLYQYFWIKGLYKPGGKLKLPEFDPTSRENSRPVPKYLQPPAGPDRDGDDDGLPPGQVAPIDDADNS